MSNFAEPIGFSVLFRNVGRPDAAPDVAPGLMRQKGDFRWPKSISRQVVEIEVLQRERTDRLLARLDAFASARRHKLGRDDGRKDGEQRAYGIIVKRRLSPGPLFSLRRDIDSDQ